MTKPQRETAAQSAVVDRWVPDYTRKCEVCGANHVVRGITDLYNRRGEVDGSHVVYQGTMCGVCTWGEADCLDPEKW